MATKKPKTGKRKWFPIYAPKIFENQVLGDTFVYETDSIVGKHVTANLMTLTGNPKKQNTRVFFVVTKLVEGKAHTKALGLELLPSSIKRLVHRGRSKIADSFLAKTKKGQLIRIKPVVLTRTRADKAAQSAIRNRTRELLVDVLSKYSFDTIMNDIINLRLQKFVKDKLCQVYPVRSVDIRFLKYAQEVDADEEVLEETDYGEEQKQNLQSMKEELLKSEQEDEQKPADEPPVEEPPTAEQPEEKKDKQNTKKAPNKKR